MAVGCPGCIATKEMSSTSLAKRMEQTWVGVAEPTPEIVEAHRIVHEALAKELKRIVDRDTDVELEENTKERQRRVQSRG